MYFSNYWFSEILWYQLRSLPQLSEHHGTPVLYSVNYPNQRQVNYRSFDWTAITLIKYVSDRLYLSAMQTFPSQTISQIRWMHIKTLIEVDINKIEWIYC